MMGNSCVHREIFDKCVLVVKAKIRNSVSLNHEGTVSLVGEAYEDLEIVTCDTKGIVGDILPSIWTTELRRC